jgi:aminoglycoside 2'-N-acetyltransferase I
MGDLLEKQGIQIRVVDSYSALDRLTLSGGETDPNRMNSFGLEWQTKTHHVLVCKQGVAVVHIGIVLQEVTVDSCSIPVSGIGGVLTRPDCRGQGFGRIGMEAVEELIRRERLAHFGMLFCRVQLRSWYERLGWVTVPAPVWIDQPGGARLSPLPVMVKCFGTKSWPPGTVWLESLPW